MPSFLINTTETMARVRVIALKEHASAVLASLQKLGVLHVETSQELRPMDRAALEARRAEVRELLGFVDGILAWAPPEKSVTLEPDTEVIYTRPYGEIRDEIRAVHNRVSLLLERIVSQGAEVDRLRSAVRYLAPLAERVPVRRRDLDFTGDALASRVIAAPTDAITAIQGRLGSLLLQSVVCPLETEAVLWVVVRPGSLPALEAAVRDCGGKAVEVPSGDSPAADETLAQFLAAAAGRVAAAERDIAGLRAELREKAGEDLKRLVLLREALGAENGRLDVLAKAAEANYVSLVEGWAPERDLPKAVEEMRAEAPQAFIDSRAPLADEAPPTKLRNYRPFRPFEQIVKIVDIPKYRGWDPTPIVSYFFAFFYGLMLSDVVYGIGLFLVARFLLPKFVDDPYDDGFRDFQRLIYLLSGVVVIFGALNGSYMGNINQLVGEILRTKALDNVALWPWAARVMGNPLNFVIMAVCIGFVHVNLAHILALVKGIQDKQIGVVLNRVGLLVTQLGVPGLLASMLKVELPLIPVAAYPYLNYAMYAGILLVVVSNYLMNKGTGLFLWIFDITGLFGDVVSYARLAGVGLATFYLGQSFNLIIKLFGQIFPGIGGAIIGYTAGAFLFVVGHTFNLILGGMGCFVHSLRLNFVEFLTKFFDGGGREYEPFRIRKRTVVPVTLKSA